MVTTVLKMILQRNFLAEICLKPAVVLKKACQYLDVCKESWWFTF